VNCLMNEVQNSYFVLFDLLMVRLAPFAEKRTRGVCLQICPRARDHYDSLDKKKRLMERRRSCSYLGSIFISLEEQLIIIMVRFVKLL